MQGHAGQLHDQSAPNGGLRVKPEFLIVSWLGAGTITNAAKVLQREGAREVYACASHAVFSPPATERLSSGVFSEVSGSQMVQGLASALVGVLSELAPVWLSSGRTAPAC